MNTLRQVLKVTLMLLPCCVYSEESTEPQYTTPTRRTKTVSTTLSYEEFLKQERKKRMHFEYFPNYGYEPYWADGEWVLSTTTVSISEGTITTKRLRVCGEECNYLFRRVHEVCGRWSTDLNDKYYGCGEPWWDFASSFYCSGQGGINFDGIFHTFNTYCEFLDAQCRADFYYEYQWILVKFGKCKPLDEYYGTLWHAQQPYDRMLMYLHDLNPTPSTAPPPKDGR